MLGGSFADLMYCVGAVTGHVVKCKDEKTIAGGDLCSSGGSGCSCKKSPARGDMFCQH